MRTIFAAYKCLVLNSKSRPGLTPSETGMGPLSMLSAKSNTKSLDRFPIDGGIGPLKPLAFKDL